MTEGDGKRRGAGRLIEDAIAEDEVERIGALSPEALAEEMKKEGRDPARAKAVAEKALAAADTSVEPAGKVVSLDARRKRRRTWTALALVAASFVGYVGYKSLEPSTVAQAPPGPADLQSRARGLRKEAFAACDKGNAAVCRDKLDQAKELDPGGEQDSEVTQARARIKQIEAASAGER
jgi:hypothetical protein